MRPFCPLGLFNPFFNFPFFVKLWLSTHIITFTMSAQFISFPVTWTLPLAPTILTSRLWEADSSRASVSGTIRCLSFSDQLTSLGITSCRLIRLSGCSFSSLNSPPCVHAVLFICPLLVSSPLQVFYFLYDSSHEQGSPSTSFLVGAQCYLVREGAF